VHNLGDMSRSTHAAAVEGNGTSGLVEFRAHQLSRSSQPNPLIPLLAALAVIIRLDAGFQFWASAASISVIGTLWPKKGTSARRSIGTTDLAHENTESNCTSERVASFRSSSCRSVRLSLRFPSNQGPNFD